MTGQYNQEAINGTAIIVDASIKNPIDKEQLLKLLQSHGVKTDSINNLKTVVEDVLPSLRKSKINIPEAFFEDLASKLELTFLNYPKVKKIYRDEQKSKLITVLPIHL